MPEDGLDPSVGQRGEVNLDLDYTGKINGEEVTKPLKYWIERGQKAEGAEARFQEASAMVKKAEKAQRVFSNLQRWVETEDQDAYVEMLKDVGVSEDVSKGVMEDFQRPPGDLDDTPPVQQTQEPKAPSEADDVNRQLVTVLRGMKTELDALRAQSGKFESLDPKLQRLMNEQEVARQDKIVQSALDKDETLAYHIASRSPEGQKVIRNLIREKIEGRLDGPDADFGDGTSVLKAVLPEVKALLEGLDIPTTSIPPDGLGPSPSRSASGIGPPTEPKHVRSGEGPEFEQHILDLLEFNLNKASEST